MKTGKEWVSWLSDRIAVDELCKDRNSRLFRSLGAMEALADDFESLMFSPRDVADLLNAIADGERN